jgi:translocation and assembly module TamA
LACLAAALWLVACASPTGGITTSSSAAAASSASGSEPAAASPPDAAASASATVAYRLQVDASPELERLLRAYMDLARFQAEAEGITSAELDRLAAAAPAQARSLLETEGYFNAQVTVDRSHGDDGLPLLTVRVIPGPRTIVSRWELVAQGELKESATKGDNAAQILLNRLQRTWALRQGDAFRQSAWNSAKNDALALLRAEGYPAAAWVNTEAHVDARAQEAVLDLRVDSGPLYRLGEIRIEGLSRYDEGAVRNVADFGPGDPYSEKRLLDFQERLGKIGLFEGVSVDAQLDPNNPLATPILVKVRELTLQQAITGIGFNNNTGPGITLEHVHHRPFGFNVQAHNKLIISRDLRSWEGELITNPRGKQYRNFIAPSISRLDTAGDITVSSRVRVGRSLQTEQIERLIFGEYLNSTVTNILGHRQSEALSLNYNWIWRDVDSVILPSRGLTTSIQVGGGEAFSNYAEAGPFSRIYTRNTLYWPLGGGWLSVSRLEVADLLAAENVGIPEPLLFRAGGDDSVRGYGYRTLGPTVEGVLTSGRKLLTASVEVSHPFSSARPAFGWAAFVDAGNAANQWDQMNLAVGYGLGLRWRSPVGPFRIDYAYGQELHKARLHLSVGIAF